MEGYGEGMGMQLFSTRYLCVKVDEALSQYFHSPQDEESKDRLRWILAHYITQRIESSYMREIKPVTLPKE